MMYYTGIDIGTTASKVVVLDAEKMVANFVIPTGWNSKDTSREIARRLGEMGYPIDENNKVRTGGLSECEYVIKSLSRKVGREIYSDPLGRYAGALGATLIARDGKKLV